jgi:hypothetical protein
VMKVGTAEEIIIGVDRLAACLQGLLPNSSQGQLLGLPRPRQVLVVRLQQRRPVAVLASALLQQQVLVRTQVQREAAQEALVAPAPATMVVPLRMLTALVEAATFHRLPPTRLADPRILLTALVGITALGVTTTAAATATALVVARVLAG